MIPRVVPAKAGTHTPRAPVWHCGNCLRSNRIRCLWVPARAEPVIGPAEGRTRWLGRDDGYAIHAVTASTNSSSRSSLTGANVLSGFVESVIGLRLPYAADDARAAGWRASA
jgi:hypothetical protein